jgi:hypothetical protein
MSPDAPVGSSEGSTKDSISLTGTDIAALRPLRQSSQIAVCPAAPYTLVASVGRYYVTERHWSEGSGCRQIVTVPRSTLPGG